MVFFIRIREETKLRLKNEKITNANETSPEIQDETIIPMIKKIHIKTIGRDIMD
jgi:hypothetical protein